MTQSDDMELAKRAAAGDRAAFASLVERHYDFIYRIAYRWCGSVDDAQDVAHDVCVKLGHVIAGFEGRSAFTSWLYRVTLNVVRDRQRQEIRRQETRRQTTILSSVADNNPSHTPQPEHDLTVKQLWQAIRKLPRQQRDAMLLVYGEDLSHREAGEIMDCKEATVSWHLHEAKKKLKQDFEGLLP